jgi:hypothetical protein
MQEAFQKYGVLIDFSEVITTELVNNLEEILGDP